MNFYLKSTYCTCIVIVYKPFGFDYFATLDGELYSIIMSY